MDTSKLGRILDMLDGERIAEVVGNDHEMARESFRLRSNTVANHPEFYSILLRYYMHHFDKVLGKGVPMPEEMAAGQARNIVENAYREYGGYEGAYNNARTGKAGGMRAVLNAIADDMRRQQEQRYIENVFYTQIDPMNYEDIVEVMRQYLDRFGGYLSPAERARSPHELARNYDTIIKAHARAMSSIRGMLKRV